MERQASTMDKAIAATTKLQGKKRLFFFVFGSAAVGCLHLNGGLQNTFDANSEHSLRSLSTPLKAAQTTNAPSAVSEPDVVSLSNTSAPFPSNAKIYPTIDDGDGGTVADDGGLPTSSLAATIRKPDGCGHHPHHSHYSNTSQEDLGWLHQAHKCVQKFQHVDIKFPHNFQADIQTLQCELTVSFDLTLDTLLQYGTVWFIGDSILAQQFYTLLCMVNPDLNITRDMDSYESTDPIHKFNTDDLFISKYVHPHPRNNLQANTFSKLASMFNHIRDIIFKPTHPQSSSSGQLKTTTFLYSKFGYQWNPRETNLYKDGKAFSTAIQNLTQQDAIIVDAGSHYNSQRVPQMENAQQHTNASVFYMEPTPEEWPTSNGVYAEGCRWMCQCQKLTEEHLQGHYNWSSSASAVQHISMEERHRLPAPSLEIVDKYRLGVYPNETTNKNSTAGYPTADIAMQLHPHYHHNEHSCYPDCLPASWRYTVAHSILGNVSKTETEDRNQGGFVTIVPIYWQLVHKPTPLYVNHGDCTHKNYEGIVNMNQQLVRSMAERQQRQRQGSEVI